jgi:hypothetical protein
MFKNWPFEGILGAFWIFFCMEWGKGLLIPVHPSREMFSLSANKLTANKKKTQFLFQRLQSTAIKFDMESNTLKTDTK